MWLWKQLLDCAKAPQAPAAPDESYRAAINELSITDG